jgi:hypothetical protein
VPERFDHSALPSGATAEAAYDGFGATVSLNTPESFTAQYFSFAFPGWTAAIDGQPVPVIPSDPEGLITFPVPAGSHVVTISWGSTSLRSALSLVSILALTGTVLAFFYLSSQDSGRKTEPTLFSNNRFPAIGLMLIALALLAFKVLLVDAELTPLRRSGKPVVEAPANLQAAELLFAGHNLSQNQVNAGESFDIDLAWSVLNQTQQTYQSNIWLSDEQGLLWSDKETYRPRLYEEGPATWEMVPGQWTWDSREVQVLPGTPPGQYDIVMTLFNRENLQPVTLVDETGAVVGPTAVIGQIDVKTPVEPPSFTPQYPLETSLAGSSLKLLGFNQDRAQAAPGDQVLLTFFWEHTAGPLPGDLQVQLLDENDQVAYSWQIPLIKDNFQKSAWEAGQRLRAQHLLRLPASLESGIYQLILQDRVPLGELGITTPERLFSAPSLDTEAKTPFGEEILLTGYSTTRDGDRLMVDLVWQSLDEMTTAYNIFVHLVDEQGTIIAQSDGEPSNWSRPTTGWVPGEYIVDQHILALSHDMDLDELRLRVGLYAPATGQRLPTPSGDSAELWLTR